MASSLKRKREKETKARKILKAEGEFSGSDVGSSDHDMSGHPESVDEVDDSDVDEEDAEEWGGITDAQPDENIKLGEEHPTNSSQQPTGKELRVIRDATDLFRSSSFKLQIDALLPNVRPKASRIPPLDRFLLALHALLMALPSVTPRHPLEAARDLLKKGVAVPYSLPLPSEGTNWRVGFEKPSEITLVGSWPNKLSVKAKDGVGFGVDLAVEMPDSLFQEKDYLNGRFFHKRAFYLAIIAAAIRNSERGLNVDLSYDSPSDDPRLTRLILVARKDGSQNDFTKLNAHVCIIPVLSSHSPILLHRLSPLHSNIRISSNDENKSPDAPTPIYNTAILTTLTPKSHLLISYTLKAESPSFRDALTLLRTWANQRGYGGGAKICVLGFNGRGALWSALLGLLISGEEPLGSGRPKKKPLGRGLSSYQLFRAALDFLSNHDFIKDPVFVKTTNGHRYPPDEYQATHEIVFIDSSSTVNLLTGVPLGSIELLRHDAQKTLESLDHASISGDRFTDVFLKDHRDLATRFDTVLRVDLSAAKPINQSIQTTLDTGSPANALMASLSSLLHHGLGDRTKVVAILHPFSAPRPLSQAHPSNPEVIYIGLIHDPEHAFRLVDHGPAADEEDQLVIQRFRDFWGPKAELRRFKDGRIVESVVWDVKTVDERTHVPGLIVRHVLNRHFDVREDAVQTWQAAFDSVLKLPKSISSVYIGSEIATGFKGAIIAFDKLAKQIKTLDDELPLSLTNVNPVTEGLRYTSVFSPVPVPVSLAASLSPNACFLHPMDIILEFEKSSKWPDDLRAIQEIKLAFFERIATALMKSVEGLTAAVVISDGIDGSEILDQATLEIVTPEGWAFSARIWHDREATLLDRILDGKKKALPHITQNLEGNNHRKAIREAVEAKTVYTRRFIHAPRHHRAIASLCHHYSALAGTVRLVKRWLASHWLLQGHIRGEAVELICASVFVGDGRGLSTIPDVIVGGLASVPGTKERGFAAVVDFLKEWKWEDGLFVSLYDAELRGAAEPLTVKGSALGVWAITTEFDKGGHMWTSPGPDLIVANRVRSLAAATWDYLQLMERGTLDVRSMFIHPDDDYDFIVRLNPIKLTRYFQNISADESLLSRPRKYANHSSEELGVPIRRGFDPARLLFNDIQRVYADTFKIFFDPFGGDRFGAVWDPSLRQPRPFRVLGGFSSMPAKKENRTTKDKNMVTLNEGAILSELERLGTGLIQEIIVHV